MADIERLRKAAEDFNIVMKLNPPIDLELGKEDLTVLILRAIDLIDRKIDVFTPETESVIAEFTKPEEKIPPDRASSLMEQVEDAQKLSDLKELVNSNDEFTSLRENLSKYKMAASLRDDMLDILEGGTEEKSDKIIPEEEAKAGKIRSTKKEKELISDPQSDPQFEKHVAESETEFIMTPTVMRAVSEIVTRPPFSKLFSISDTVLDSVTQDMEKNGFDYAFPLVIWEEEGVLLDGHTRLAAAKKLNIPEVPVELKQFESEKEALEYSVHNQRDRRNMSDAELLLVIEALDSTSKVGRKAAGEVAGGKTADRTARKLKTSKDKVKAARKVLKDPKAKEDVLTGKKSIRGAADELRKKDRKEKAKTDVKPITRFQAIATIIRENKGGEIEVDELAKEADVVFSTQGGKTNLEKMKGDVEFVIEILTSLNLVQTDEKNVIHIASW